MKILIFLSFILCSTTTVTPFSWSNCGGDADSIKVTSLDVKSNKNNFLYVTGKGKVAVDILSPIQGKVEMYKKFFWGWTLIPCVEGVGSCTYNDLCGLSPYTDQPCPQEFVDNNLPCKCPLLQGSYVAKKFPIDLKILPHWIESGRYKIKMNVKKDKQELLCIVVHIDL